MHNNVISEVCIWWQPMVSNLRTSPDQTQGRRALDRVTATTCALPLTVPNSDAWWVPSQSVAAPCASSVKLACTTVANPQLSAWCFKV